MKTPEELGLKTGLKTTLKTGLKRSLKFRSCESSTINSSNDQTLLDTISGSFWPTKRAEEDVRKTRVRRSRRQTLRIREVPNRRAGHNGFALARGLFLEPSSSPFRSGSS